MTEAPLTRKVLFEKSLTQLLIQDYQRCSALGNTYVITVYEGEGDDDDILEEIECTSENYLEVIDDFVEFWYGS